MPSKFTLISYIYLIIFCRVNLHTSYIYRVIFYRVNLHSRRSDPLSSINLQWNGSCTTNSVTITKESTGAQIWIEKFYLHLCTKVYPILFSSNIFEETVWILVIPLLYKSNRVQRTIRTSQTLLHNNYITGQFIVHLCSNSP